MKRVLLGIGLLVALAAGVMLFRALPVGTALAPSPSAKEEEAPAATTTPAQTPLRFEIADTPAKQELGLGKRTEIPDDYGMLFVFTTDGSPGFWMKDMLVPIDIIWLDRTGTIVNVDASVRPSTYPAVFHASVPVRYVLETRAGYAASHGWGIGTKVPLPAPYGT